MASRYVPPALRSKGQGGSNANASASTSRSDNAAVPTYSVSGLRGGEGSSRPPRRRSDVMLDEEVYSFKEIDGYFWPKEEFKSALVENSKTLHDSASSPGKLAYVLLFKDANPRWETDGIIFTKSSLDLLPAEMANEPDTTAPASETTITPSVSNDVNIDSLSTSNGGAAHQKREAEVANLSKLDPPAREQEPDPSSQQEHQPIAIFTQSALGARSYKLGHRSFKFLSYYRITHLQFLEPNTPDLARMLKQKWTVTNQRTGKAHERQRDAQSWEKSFNLRWAVVKFEKDEAAEEKLGKPQIERLNDDQEDDVDGGRGKKSVNDLLRELRMKDGEGKAEKQKEDTTIDKNAAASAHATQEKPKEETHVEV